MRKINKISLITTLVISATLHACSSGSSNSSNTAPLADPQGPIDYKMFVHGLLSQVPNNKIKKQSLKGTAWTEVGNIANLNPFATLAYQTINLIVGNNNATTVSTNQIYSEELNISNQITDLQNQLTNDQNVIYNWYLNQIQTDLNSAASLFDTTITNMNDTYNNYALYVLMVNGNGPYSLESIPSSGVVYFYQNMPNQAINNNNFPATMINLSNASCAATIPNTQWDTFESNYPYGTVNGAMATLNSFKNQTSQLVALLTAMQNELFTYINAPGTPIIINGESSNITTLISQYNQMVEYTYQRSLVALQQAYILEASGNYFQAYSNSATPGAALFSSECANSNYNSLDSAALSYTYSQAYLVQLFADRMNALYQTASHYIVSDIPMIPLNNLQESYSLEINGTTPAKNMYNLGNNQSIISGGWQESGLLYQESTIMGYQQCNAAFKAGESLNSTNCPQLMPNMYNGYYDGESLTAYMIANNGKSYVLSGASGTTTPFDFTGYCMPESGISSLSTQLFCNNWSGSLMANSNTLNSNLNIESFPALQSLISTPLFLNYGGCYYYYEFNTKNKYTYALYQSNNLTCSSLPDNAYNNSNYAWYGMANNPIDSYTYYVAGSSLGSNNFMLLASSTYDSTPGFTLGSGEFYTTGSNTGFQLNDGGFDENTSIINNSGPFSHSGLLQVTLPNGYNFPFYVLSYIAVENPQKSNNSHTYSSPICPAIFGIAVSGITSCTQQNLGNGGLTVTTADGSTYYLNLLQPSDGQEMQYGFFQISTTAQTSI